jgi:hypothetical protein
MLYYNFKVTGNPLDTPYASHYRQYDLGTPFLWSKARPQPPVQNAHIREVHRWEYNDRTEQMTVIMKIVDWRLLSQLYLGIPLSICTMCALPFIRWWRLRTGPLVAMSLPLVLSLLMFVWVSPHYAAPAAAAYYIVGIVVLRRMFHAWPLVTQCLVAFVLLNAVGQYKNPANQWLWNKQDFIADRKSVLHKLEQVPGRKVVFVEYRPGYDVNQEWIYNRADIDHSETIWAHEMGPKNEDVINYYPDRQFWRLVASKGRLELTRLVTGGR